MSVEWSLAVEENLTQPYNSDTQDADLWVRSDKRTAPNHIIALTDVIVRPDCLHICSNVAYGATAQASTSNSMTAPPWTYASVCPGAAGKPSSQWDVVKVEEVQVAPRLTPKAVGPPSLCHGGVGHN